MNTILNYSLDDIWYIFVIDFKFTNHEELGVSCSLNLFWIISGSKNDTKAHYIYARYFVSGLNITLY